MSFNELGLSAALLRAVNEQGYTIPTPVQKQAIPPILEGGDLMAAAQTGTGKTAGFTLPMLQRLAASAPAGGKRPVRALILTPTRELAAQVHDSVRTYGQHLSMKSAVIFGGVGMQPQIDKLRRGVDIVVATPGRLLDHIGRGTVDLSRVETLVLDEADRMLDMGFIRDIRKILAKLPGKRQTLMFSATFSNEIRKLSADLLNDPVRIDVAPRNTAAETVSQVIHPVSRDAKRGLLSHLISAGNWQQVLVFSRTKHGANRLAKQLNQDGLEADAIHGNKSQAARTRALAGFKKNKLRVLVATDIAARGLDINELPHVVNFDLPSVPEDYVHRIGRTGRAGHGGQAHSLVCVDEHKLLRDIEKMLGNGIDKQVVPGFEPDPSEQPKPLFKQPQGGRGGGRGGRGGSSGRGGRPQGGSGRSQGNSGRRNNRSRNAA